MGMLMHRHLDESANIETQKPVEQPSAVKVEQEVTTEDKPVKAPSRPVKRAVRGRAK